MEVVLEKLVPRVVKTTPNIEGLELVVGTIVRANTVPVACLYTYVAMHATL